MERTSKWLTYLGLPQYVDAFEDNDIEWDTLPDLDDADLREIGVHSLGHRKKILKAIRELETTHDSSDEFSVVPATSGERRQITVMFCDLVGSTELSTKIDAEDMDAVIRRYQETVTPIVHEFGGHVARFAGDGILSYFGYPHALEREAERAIRTSLKVVSAIEQASLHSGIDSRVRIGIATGNVVIGDLYESGKLYEAMATGETPNLAARLQSFVGPGGIATCDLTKRQTRDVFEFADEGRKELRGFGEPVQIWSVRGIASEPHEASATRKDADWTPLQGRETEHSRLMTCWKSVQSERGRTVLVSGEAGLGKSRLIETLQNDVRPEEASILRLYCEPYHRSTPFHPIIDFLQRAAGIGLEDSRESNVDKLANFVVGRYPDEQIALPLLANLLDIANDDHMTLLMRLSPRRLKNETIETLVSSIEMLARERPVLLLTEDMHWVDASTREFLEALHCRIATAPIMLLLTARPEFTLEWPRDNPVEYIELRRLDDDSAAKIVDEIAGKSELSEPIREQILEKAEGIPLYLEELTRSMLDEIRHGSKEQITEVRFDQASVPDALQSTLLARLDRLGKAKDLALLCSVIGRKFDAELLAHVVDRDTDAINPALQQLVDAELLQVAGQRGTTSYVFRHALLRDAAYNNLLRSRRREIHLKIADVLTAHYPMMVLRRPERLAHHFTAGGNFNDAIQYWLRAGSRALRASANIEAIEHLRQGLSLLHNIEDEATRLGLELQLQVTLGPALISIRGFAAEEVNETFSRAREICEIIGDASGLFQALRGLMAFYTVGARYDSTLDIGRQLEMELRDECAPDKMVELHWSIASAEFYKGHISEAIRHCEEGIPYYEPEAHAKHAHIYGQDPGVATLTHLALACSTAAQYDRSREIESEVMARVERLGHPFTRAQANSFILSCLRIHSELDSVSRMVEETLALSQAQSFPVWTGLALVNKGWCMAKNGEAVGLKLIEQGMAIYAASGAQIAKSEWLRLAADAHLCIGDVRKGLAYIENSIAHVNAYDERLYESAIYQLKGELLLAENRQDNMAAAIDSFKRGIEVGRNTGTRHFELMSALSLAELEQAEDAASNEGRNCLDRVMNQISQGADVPIVRRALRLLECA